MNAVIAPPGLQEYVGLEAEVVAVNVAEPPAQMFDEFTLTLGSGFTVTVPEPELTHLVTPSVTVTV